MKFLQGSFFRRFWYVPVLVVYAAMVACAASVHCGWFDEAQAWLIARDCDLTTMFTEILRREGHPALWYLIVKAAIYFHLPYDAFSYLSGAIATLGVWVLLAKSPFPKWFTVLLPFSFYLGYQYAVIARSYVLLPLLLFTLAALHRQRWERPIAWCCVLALLANVSVHSFAIAAGIMLLHAIELAVRWRSLDSNAKRMQAKAIAVYCFGALFAVITTFPTKDCVTPNGLTGQLPLGPLAWHALAAIDHAFFECSFLTAAFLAASCWWFWRTGVLPLFVAVCSPIVLIFALLHVSPQHEGILLLAWLFVFWCSVDRFIAMRQNGELGRHERVAWAVMLTLAAGLAIRQDVWTGQTMAFERRHPYSGACELAKYIHSHDLTKYRIAGVHEWITAVLPYFSRNFFVNFPNDRQKSFIDWRCSNFALKKAFAADEALAEPCDILIWPEQDLSAPPTPSEYPQFAARTPRDWRYIAHFEGLQIYHNHVVSCGGYAVFATRRIADKLGLDEAKGGDPESDRLRQPAWNCTNFYWQVLRIMRFHIDFSTLLRKMSPEDSLRQSQFVIDVAAHTDFHDATPGDIRYFKSIAAVAHNNVGIAMSATNPTAAIEHYRESLKLDPNNADVYGNLALALAKKGRLDEAKSVLEQAAQVFPNDGRIQFLLQLVLRARAGGKKA